MYFYVRVMGTIPCDFSQPDQPVESQNLSLLLGCAVLVTIMAIWELLRSLWDYTRSRVGRKEPYGPEEQTQAHSHQAHPDPYFCCCFKIGFLVGNRVGSWVLIYFDSLSSNYCVEITYIKLFLIVSKISTVFISVL